MSVRIFPAGVVVDDAAVAAAAAVVVVVAAAAGDPTSSQYLSWQLRPSPSHSRLPPQLHTPAYMIPTATQLNR